MFVYHLQKYSKKPENIAHHIDKKALLIYYYTYPARGFRARCMDLNYVVFI